MEEYINRHFPIDPEIVDSVYAVVSRAMCEGKNPGPVQSGLYGTRAFYSPQPGETVPLLFGTLFKKNIYAEVLFSKAEERTEGELEIALYGENKRRLSSIKNKVKKEVENLLEKKQDERRRN
jgi:hypothetical protein